ncbi:MAG TPA: flagellar basal body rod protein FlgC [Candidatus Deferrimicrobium sp.]|nr:flagellar basal body rod protein FlgC [Candidatus Deferrimicrobium sp.]
MSGILTAFDVSSKGLTVQRAKMNTVAENLANAETVETKEGGPYRRKRVIVREDAVRGAFNSMVKEARVRLARTDKQHLGGKSIVQRAGVELPAVTAREIADPESSFRLVHDPTHPKADAQGFVKMPDVEVVTEMVDMMAASRGYEANTLAISAAKKMAKDALDI